MLTVLFMCVFENIAPEHGWALRTGALQISKIVNGFIQQSLQQAAPLAASVCPPQLSLSFTYNN